MCVTVTCLPKYFERIDFCNAEFLKVLQEKCLFTWSFLFLDITIIECSFLRRHLNSLISFRYF